MPIGHSATNHFQLNSQACQLAVTLRDTCTKILALQGYVTAQGITGLQAAGFSAEDAAAFTTEISRLAGASVPDFSRPPQEKGSIHAAIAGLTGPA